MIQNYLKTLLHSLKQQKGIMAINLITLITSMVVIMVLVSVLSMDFNTGSLKAEVGVLYQIQQKEGNRYRNYYQKKTLKIVEQAFDTKDICVVSFRYSSPIISSSSFQRLDIDYRLLSENFLNYFKLDIIEGVNLQSKHFQNNQRVVVISENLAHTLFGDSTAIGNDVTLRKKRYEIIGVYQTLMKKNIYAANCYSPWDAIEHYVDMHATAFIHAKNGESKDVIEKQLNKHAQKLELAVETPKEIKKQRLGKLLLMAFIFIGLSMLLPALLLTNLTVHRMETRLIELGVRRAFGASKKVIYHQLIVENILFTLLAGLFSLLIGQYIVSGMFYEFTNGFWKLNVPINIFIYVVVVFLLFGIVTGILPARKVSRRTIIQSLNSN